MTNSKVEEIRKYFAARKVIETTYYLHVRQSKASENCKDFELHSGISNDPSLEYLYPVVMKKYADETPNFTPLGIHAEMIAKQKAGNEKRKKEDLKQRAVERVHIDLDYYDKAIKRGDEWIRSKSENGK